MLARFERLMEQAIEGSLRRVFPTSLQPIQLAKAAARAMEQAQIIGRRGIEVPNLYMLRLAAADLKRFGDYRQTLTGEVRSYLVDYARERGLRPVAELRVEIVEDQHVRPGAVRASARFDGLAPQAQADVQTAVESTRQLRLAELATAQPASATPSQAPLALRHRSAADYLLDPRLEVVRLGRAADNDVVADSQRVSRYHTQLRWVESGWLVYDLDSTNGTWLNEARLTPGRPELLRLGHRLRLGDYELEVGSGRMARGRG